MIKRICVVALFTALLAGCVFYPVQTQTEVDARHTGQAVTVLPAITAAPPVTLAPPDATATEVVIEATLEATPAPECLIKGNVNSRGEKIFHIPGSASYDRTIIDPEHGEAFFCSEGEAVHEGFRKALR